MNINSGIYKITNKLNNHCYIGSSINIKHRFGQHKVLLKNGSHRSSYFQRAWDKYGKESFVFEILIYCDKNDLFIYEQAFIDYYHPVYNLAKCAKHPMFGMKHTNKTKEKIGKSNTGKKRSPEMIEKMRLTSTGRLHTEETKRKISMAHIGMRYSEEIKERVRQSKLGIHLSPETRKKMSVAQLLRFKREKELNVAL